MARPTKSGSEPGAEIASVLPLKSATLPMLDLTTSPCSTPVQLQPMILRSAPRRPARMAEPGEDSIESISPASSALWASVPLASGTILILRPRFSSKPRRLTISEKPASPLGSITPCDQGFGACADVGVPRQANKAMAIAAARTVGDVMVASLALLRERKRIRPQLRLDDRIDIARLRQAAILHELVAHPFELLDRERNVGVDHAVFHGLVENERGTRVVRLGARKLVRELDGLVAVAGGVGDSLDLRRQEFHGVVTPGRNRLAGDVEAQAHEVRDHVAPCDQNLDPGRRDRQVLRRHDGGIHNAGGERLVAVDVTAD